MANKKMKIPKLLFAVIVAAAVMLPYFAAGFMAKPNTAHAATYAGINVGDYIDGFGGLKWRVIGKDENGLLVRTDRSVGNRQFSGAKAAGYYINETTSSPMSGGGRAIAGTNYWEQTDIRSWLNDMDEGGFADRFTAKEWEAMVAVPQRQHLWWGDAVRQWPTDSWNWRVNDPFTKVANVEGDIFYWFSYNSAPNIISIMGYYETAYSYTIKDMIFLPDVKQVCESGSMENANGDPYYIVLDESGVPVTAWTRTPIADNPPGGSELYRISSEGELRHGGLDSFAISFHAVTPALYLSRWAAFTHERASALVQGEQNGYAVYSFDGLTEPVDEDAEAVAADKAGLGWNTIKGKNVSQNEITSNLELPEYGANGSEIIWTSDNTAAITHGGTVTRPAYGDGDAEVTLTAVIVKGEASDTMTFNLTVTEAARIASGGTRPPIIDGQPIGGTVKRGASVTLSFGAFAGENDILTCQWYSNTTESNNGGAIIEGATGSVYSPPTDKAGTVYYYCVITNEGGQSVTSRAAAVTVEGADGLSGGGITAIIMISLAVLCGGGLAAYWFIIRKRRKV